MKKIILWIEDFDTKSSRHHKTRTRQTTEEKECNSVQANLAIFENIFLDVIEVKTSMFEGIKYILEHHGEFDCVILDVDMTKNLQIDLDKNTEQGLIWNKFFDHINLEMEVEEEGNKKDYRVGGEPANSYVGKNAGFFLVLFLISLGFPKERIIMYTAYGGSGGDNRVSQWEEKFNSASLFIPEIIDKGDTFNNLSGKDKKLNECLKALYLQDSQEYYLSRLFLYKLYNMFDGYKKELEEYFENKTDKTEKELQEFYKEEENKINKFYKPIFNHVCKDKDKKMTFCQVRDLLENVFFYFPCMKPNQDTQDIYYYALKLFAEPFEADYENTKIQEGNTYRVIKLYRNWSSHNLFRKEKNVLSDKMFRFLFFVEMLLFMDQKYKYTSENKDKDEDENKDKNKDKDAEDIKNFIENWINILWAKCKSICEFFFGNKIETEESAESAILSDIEKMNWELCRNWKEIPKDMIAVYDRYGKGKDVKKEDGKLRYHYLLDAFMNSFIESNIKYDETGCHTEYALSSEWEGIYKELFFHAYYLLKSILEQDIPES